MISVEEFQNRIDKLVSPDMQHMLEQELTQNPSIIDLINIQERARVLTIKQIISSTHNWTKARVVGDGGSAEECFWCSVCNMKCSVFEHTSCLSIISKVKDRRPTYTTHNQYLMLTCKETLDIDNSNGSLHCFHCGVPEGAKTDKCEIVGC